MAIHDLRVKLMKEYTDVHGIEKKQGLDTLLDYLTSHGYRTAVATATNIERAEEYLKKIGVYDKFETIICGNMLENGNAPRWADAPFHAKIWCQDSPAQ